MNTLFERATDLEQPDMFGPTARLMGRQEHTYPMVTDWITVGETTSENNNNIRYKKEYLLNVEDEELPVFLQVWMSPGWWPQPYIEIAILREGPDLLKPRRLSFADRIKDYTTILYDMIMDNSYHFPKDLVDDMIKTIYSVLDPFLEEDQKTRTAKIYDLLIANRSEV